jgi:hypothetical protein|nr:MAG TPA: hypothetical protein [Caudoviricetes sp.]
MKVAQDIDFHDDDFIIENNKVRTRKIGKSFKLDFILGKDVITTNNDRDYDKQERRQLTVLDGIGKIHLDFKMVKDSGNLRPLFRLPANAPRNLELIETQVWDGASVWLNAGNNVVYGSGLREGQRYILDLIGFFS